MAEVVFYEKPGCSANNLQKALLEASGHVVSARNLLTTSWTRMQLLSFLKLLPVHEWFNPHASMIKRGEINPMEFSDFDVATILSLLQANPILIRRPLIEVDGVCRAGFDVKAINDWIGLSAALGTEADSDPEPCRPFGESPGCCGAGDGKCCHEPGPALET